MPLIVHKDGETGVSRGKGPLKTEFPHTRHKDQHPERWGVYGRLKLTNTQIAALEGLTPHQVAHLKRRPDLRAAYDKGRGEAVVAIRQKQLQLALAGSERMLIHAGREFADQGSDEAPPDDYETGRYSWDAQMRKRLQDLHARYVSESDEEADEA